MDQRRASGSEVLMLAGFMTLTMLILVMRAWSAPQRKTDG
jgi:hypothetical protein